MSNVQAVVLIVSLLILLAIFVIAIVAIDRHANLHSVDDLMARSESPAVWRFLSDIKSGRA